MTARTSTSATMRTRRGASSVTQPAGPEPTRPRAEPWTRRRDRAAPNRRAAGGDVGYRGGGDARRDGRTDSWATARRRGRRAHVSQRRGRRAQQRTGGHQHHQQNEQSPRMARHRAPVITRVPVGGSTPRGPDAGPTVEGHRLLGRVIAMRGLRAPSPAPSSRSRRPPARTVFSTMPSLVPAAGCGRPRRT